VHGPAAILCPTTFERRAIARRLARPGARVLRCGVTPERLHAALDQALAWRPRAILIAGLAGGLRPTAPAPTVRLVRDPEGREWTPTLRPQAGDAPSATLLAAPAPVISPEHKRRLAITHDADLVDCESIHLAPRLASLDIPWAVVRGVSDGPDDPLPPQVPRWLTPGGRTNLPRLALDVARRPTLIPRLRALGAAGAGALDAACDALERLLASLEHPADE
jgi:hypothetical protein